MKIYPLSASWAVLALCGVGMLASGCGAESPPPEPLASSSTAKSEDAASAHPDADPCAKGGCATQSVTGNGRAFDVVLVGRQESGTFADDLGKPIDWRVRVAKQGAAKATSNVSVVLLTGPAGMTAKTTAPGETSLAWTPTTMPEGKTSLFFGAWDRDDCGKVYAANACARPANPDTLREYLARFGLTFAVGWRIDPTTGAGGSSATGTAPDVGVPAGADTPGTAPGPTPPGPTPPATNTATGTGTAAAIRTLVVTVHDASTGGYVVGANVRVTAPTGGVAYGVSKVAGASTVVFSGVPDSILDVVVTAGGYDNGAPQRVAAATAAQRAITVVLTAAAPAPAASLWSCRLCQEAARSVFGRGVYYFDLTVRAGSADAALAAARAMRSSCPASGPAPFTFSGTGACLEVCRAPGAAFPEYPIFGAVFPAEGKCNSY